MFENKRDERSADLTDFADRKGGRSGEKAFNTITWIYDSVNTRISD